MTSVAEVRRSKAEEHGDGTAVAAFVLEEVHSVFWAHLQEKEEFLIEIMEKINFNVYLSFRNVTAATTNEFLGIEVLSHLHIAPRFTTVISLKRRK